MHTPTVHQMPPMTSGRVTAGWYSLNSEPGDVVAAVDLGAVLHTCQVHTEHLIQLRQPVRQHEQHDLPVVPVTADHRRSVRRVHVSSDVISGRAVHPPVYLLGVYPQKDLEIVLYVWVNIC